MCVPSSICTSESEDGRGWKASLGMTWPNTTAQKRPRPGMETSEALWATCAGIGPPLQ